MSCSSTNGRPGGVFFCGDEDLEAPHESSFLWTDFFSENGKERRKSGRTKETTSSPTSRNNKKKKNVIFQEKNSAAITRQSGVGSENLHMKEERNLPERKEAIKETKEEEWSDGKSSASDRKNQLLRPISPPLHFRKCCFDLLRNQEPTLVARDETPDWLESPNPPSEEKNSAAITRQSGVGSENLHMKEAVPLSSRSVFPTSTPQTSKAPEFADSGAVRKPLQAKEKATATKGPVAKQTQDKGDNALASNINGNDGERGPGKGNMAQENNSAAIAHQSGVGEETIAHQIDKGQENLLPKQDAQVPPKKREAIQETNEVERCDAKSPAENNSAAIAHQSGVGEETIAHQIDKGQENLLPKQDAQVPPKKREAIQETNEVERCDAKSPAENNSAAIAHQSGVGEETIAHQIDKGQENLLPKQDAQVPPKKREAIQETNEVERCDAKSPARMSGREQAIQAAKKQVEQLRGERNMRRLPISQTAGELVRYTQDLQREDVLMTGFANDKMNPYRPKSSFQCSVL